MPAGNFLWRAVWLAVALAALVQALLGGTILWTVVSGMAVAVTTANGIWPLRQALELIDVGDELGVAYIALVGLIAPGLLILCSPFVLAWLLTRAYRAAVRPPAIRYSAPHQPPAQPR